jgi:hypothetical protein
MKSLRRVLFLLLALILGISTSAQSLKKTGTTAAQFLKIGVGARAVGMGTAFTATSDDISAIYWNPAGLANNKGNEVIFNHTQWFADIGFDFAAISTHISGLGTLGAYATILSIDEMPVRTLENPEGTGETFKSGSISIGLSFARFLTDNFAIGFNAKYIRDFIWNSSATGFALDAGTIYKIPVLNELRLAASISNFGTKMKMDGRDILSVQQVGGGQGNLINTKVELDEFDLPLLFRVGIAVDVIKSESSRLTAAVDAVHPNDHTEYVNFGTEYAWKEIVRLRIGYKSLFEVNTEEGLTAGVGINYGIIGSVRLLIDYAYQDFGRLEEVHYFTVGLKF